MPIPSIEKFLKSKCIIEKDKKFIKLIGDKYFNQRSIHNIIADYMSDPRTSMNKDTDGKNFYRVILSSLERIRIVFDFMVDSLVANIFE